MINGKLDMTALAVKGAELLIQEHRRTIQELETVLRDLLHTSHKAFERRAKRQRRHMTEAQRKAVSLRMKRYWRQRAATK